MLSLGYFSIELKSGWSAQALLVGDVEKVSLVRGQARAELSLLSGGENAEETFEELLIQLEADLRLRAGHFDNLLEDHDNEMIVEKIEDDFDSKIQHFFVRKCASIIVITILEDYLPEDENDIREMLATLQPGELICHQPALTHLSLNEAVSSWNTIGKIAIFG